MRSQLSLGGKAQEAALANSCAAAAGSAKAGAVSNSVSLAGSWAQEFMKGKKVTKLCSVKDIVEKEQGKKGLDDLLKKQTQIAGEI